MNRAAGARPSVVTGLAVAVTGCDLERAPGLPSVAGPRLLGRVSRVSVVQTILIYAVIPLAIYGLVALLTLRDKVAKAPRYRPGQPWDYPAVWWTANPAGADASAVPTGGGKARRTAKGGARGSW